MKFTLELFKQFKVKYSWITLLVGRKLGLVHYNSVIIFAEELVNKNPELNDLNVIELLWANNEDQIDQILERIVIDSGEAFDYSTERRRWIFCILSSFKESIKSDEELLEKVAELYSLMGYPEEMVSFIYYMPPRDGYDPSVHTKKENYSRMIGFLDQYLEKERKAFYNI